MICRCYLCCVASESLGWTMDPWENKRANWTCVVLLCSLQIYLFFVMTVQQKDSCWPCLVKATSSADSLSLRNGWVLWIWNRFMDERKAQENASWCVDHPAQLAPQFLYHKKNRVSKSGSNTRMILNSESANEGILKAQTSPNRILSGSSCPVASLSLVRLDESNQANKDLDTGLEDDTDTFSETGF